MNNASLQQLHDIVLPQAPGIFPLALGWWLLITILIVMTGLLVKKLIANYQQWDIKRLALIKLAHCNDCNEINQLLKQVAMHYCHDVKVSTLTGQDWALFLDKNLSPSSQAQLVEIFETLYTAEHAKFFEHYQIIAKQWLTNLNKRSLLEMNNANL